MVDPAIPHLCDALKRARLIALRAAVEPILANNLLPHFTAHDIEHCDRVVQVIGKFVEPLQASSVALTAQELFVVYAAAYLHDLGMHYERVGESPAIRESLGKRQWANLTDDERRDLLRQHHPKISSELVAASVRNGTPPIAFTLDDDDSPGPIADLCEAHGTDTRESRYAVLTQDAPDIRMALLAGILRCADILEESRRRANRARAESLLLPLSSQVHWWRHYYTVDVTFDQAERSIDVWFEFPAARGSELERVVPELQLPAVREELDRHQQTFVRYNVVWVVRSRISPRYTAEQVPDAVLHEMLVTIAGRRAHEAEERQRALALVYDEARPLLERRLEDLRGLEGELASEVFAERLRDLANDMARIGAAASARSLLREAATKAANADARTRLRIGLQLGAMLADVGWWDQAARLHGELLPTVLTLAQDDPSVDQYWNAKIDSEIRAGWFEKSIESMRRRGSLADNDLDKSRRAELDFLQGTFSTTNPG
jgi:hypothetical protein